MRSAVLAAAFRSLRGRLPERFGAFRRDERGVYIVEFALLAFPFFGLLFSLIEVAFATYVSTGLQAAVTEAARKVMTGEAQQQNYANSASFVSSLLCPTTGKRLMPSNVDCSKLIVDVRAAADFSTADMGRSFYKSTPTFCLGRPGTIVVLRVIYPLGAVLPISLYDQYVGLVNDVPNNAGWKHLLMGSAAFMTEPYSGNAPSC